MSKIKVDVSFCPHCTFGNVRKFKARTETEMAMFYDEICEVCKGDFRKETPLPINQQLDIIADTAEEDSEIPF